MEIKPLETVILLAVTSIGSASKTCDIHHVKLFCLELCQLFEALQPRHIWGHSSPT